MGKLIIPVDLEKLNKSGFNPTIIPGVQPQGQIVLECNTGDVSDSYHTFNELYEHRHALFLALMRIGGSAAAWWSKRHSDGQDAYAGWVLCCVELPADIGPITYHLPDRLIPAIIATGAVQLDQGKEWDGHTSNDVLVRLERFATFHGLTDLDRRLISFMVGSPQQEALGKLREARAALLGLRDVSPSRELSLAITEAETALLWLQEDMRLKQPVVNGCGESAASPV